MEVIRETILGGATTIPPTKKLKCICWNINNYKSETFKIKLENGDFLEKIFGADIICLVETHTVKRDVLNIPGYGKPYRVNRRTFNKKAYGGIAVFFKLELLNGFDICQIDASSENIL